MAARLLREECNDVRVLTEEHDGKKHLTLQGIYAQSNVTNGNGRVYPRALLEREVTRFDAEKIQKGTAYGTLGHPAEDTPNTDMARVSHRIVELKQDRSTPDNFIGKAILIPEGMGKIAIAIHETGGALGASTRGMGTVKEEFGRKVVQPDYILLGVDLVSNPSAPEAFLNGIMEGHEWVYNVKDDAWYPQMVEDARKSLHKMPAGKLRRFKEYLAESAKVEPNLVADERVEPWMVALLRFPTRFSPW